MSRDACGIGLDIGGGLVGGERRPGNEVNRGRIYDNVDGAGGGGGVGGRGGGNQLCSERRARSEVTWRRRWRSALDPTM